MLIKQCNGCTTLDFHYVLHLFLLPALQVDFLGGFIPSLMPGRLTAEPLGFSFPFWHPVNFHKPFNVRTSRLISRASEPGSRKALCNTAVFWRQSQRPGSQWPGCLPAPSLCRHQVWFSITDCGDAQRLWESMRQNQTVPFVQDEEEVSWARGCCQERPLNKREMGNHSTWHHTPGFRDVQVLPNAVRTPLNAVSYHNAVFFWW